MAGTQATAHAAAWQQQSLATLVTFFLAALSCCTLSPCHHCWRERCRAGHRVGAHALRWCQSNASAPAALLAPPPLFFLPHAVTPFPPFFFSFAPWSGRCVLHVRACVRACVRAGPPGASSPQQACAPLTL